jgi:regulator of sigma E protease
MTFSVLFPIFGKILPVVCSLIGFGILIAVHEFGHFIFCQAFNVHTPTFSIGFGPELYKRKIGTTNFRIAAIPLGGYVEIAGLAEIGQGEQAHAQDTTETSFTYKPFWQKAFILLGGILFNIFFAYLAFCIIFIAGNRSAQPEISVMTIVPESAAEKAGLKVQDTILGINNKRLSTDPIALNKEMDSVVLQQIQAHPNKEITLLIKRNQEELTLNITLGSRQEDGTAIGVLGAGFQPPRLPFWYAFKAGFDYTKKIITLICKGIKMLFSTKSLEGAAGPVMILAQGAATAKHGFIPLLHFLGIISLSLALMNLLPIGALDGGQLLFTTIEVIIRRRIPEIIKVTINLASWVLLLSLMAYFTYREIGMLFGKTFKAWWCNVVGLFR